MAVERPRRLYMAHSEEPLSQRSAIGVDMTVDPERVLADFLTSPPNPGEPFLWKVAIELRLPGEDPSWEVPEDAWTGAEELMTHRHGDARSRVEFRPGRWVYTSLRAVYIPDGNTAADHDLALRVGLYLRTRLRLGATSLIGVELAQYEPEAWDIPPPSLDLA